MQDTVRAVHELKCDDPRIARKVTHWFYFNDKEDMDRLIIAALDLGHTIHGSWDSGTIEDRWGLITVFFHPVDDASLLSYYHQHTRFAERYQGTYDGYEYAIGADPDDEIRAYLHPTC